MYLHCVTTNTNLYHTHYHLNYSVVITKLLGDIWLTLPLYTSTVHEPLLVTASVESDVPIPRGIALRRVPSFVSQIVLLNHGNHAWLPQFELAAYKVSALVVPKEGALVPKCSSPPPRLEELREEAGTGD